MSKPDSQNGPAAKFLSGSIMRHILTMSATSAAGLIGVFLVDLLDLFFLSMLGSDDIIAGVGFAGSLSFFTISISIGFSIAMAALVSQMIGQRRAEQARRYVVNIGLLALGLTTILALIIWPNLPALFELLGAEDEALKFGVSYLEIVLISLPILAVGLSFSSALRAVGDAKLAMHTSLIGGVANAILDPIFIFALGLGVEGAAIATVLGRAVALALAYWGVCKKHQLLTRFHFKFLTEDLKPIFAVAGPSILTNMVTPVGNAIVIHAVAKYGAGYVAGFSVIARVAPVAFSMVYGLSGAIAPIIGQNYGGRAFGRIKKALRDALLFNAAYVAAVAIALFLLHSHINQLFNLEGEAAELISVFCTWVAITYIFNGTLFIANATFNNLGKPIYGTWFNVGRSTLGTLPFVTVGGYLGGGPGVLIGQAIGTIVFAIAAVIVAFRYAHNLEQQALK